MTDQLKRSHTLASTATRTLTEDEMHAERLAYQQVKMQKRMQRASMDVLAKYLPRRPTKHASAPHVPRRCPVCWPPDVLERVFPADQCDWEYVAQREGRLNMPEPWATHVARAQVAAAADRRPIDDEGDVA